ncbi:DNA-binding protein MNB1B-like [Zingiber officinale]|uniref:DNA-binding protein MNB1B-like n=1 Tax=Zingiber officinale TaxID=94328 RepID=UPI001C4DBB1C|nr:DNA-binding protein MNB1B-like [Zingiber officinale]
MKRGKSKTDAPKKADTKLSVKKGPERAAKKPRKFKDGKDPNTPKRPQSAFFVFMEEFWKMFKEKNPNNKSVAMVAKAGGDKWKSLTEEKAPYVAKAAKLKAGYTKTMVSYNKRSRAAATDEAEEEGEESDKSKSKVNDDDDEEEDKEDDE